MMYFSCSANLNDYFRTLKGFRRFIDNQKGRFIYHVEDIDRINVPFFNIDELVAINNIRFKYDDTKRLRVYTQNCYFESAYPFECVRMCFLHQIDRLIIDNEVLQALHFIFRYRMLCLNGISLHSAVIEDNGMAIAFMGFSGAGKSTQAALWQRYRNAFALNLDKPAVFFDRDAAVIAGTPWSGKEYAFVNRECPLKAIVLPRKSNENRVSSITGTKTIVELLQNNLIYPISEEIDIKHIEAVEKLADCVQMFRLDCTINEEAVKVLYERVYERKYVRKERKRTELRISSEFMLRNIADEWIVIARGEKALKFSATILLNETGAFMWNLLKNECSMEQLVDEMTAEYDVEREIAEHDVKIFVQQLKDAGVLEVVDGKGV